MELIPGSDTPLFFVILGSVINYILLIIFIYVLKRKNLISDKIFLALVITNYFPFLTNGVFIPEYLFPDQGGYVDNIRAFRSTFNPFGVQFELRHQLPSKVFAFLSSLGLVPFVENNTQASFVNRFIISTFASYLYSKKILKENQILILMIYPSLLLYSSLFLKDIMVSVLMTMTFLAVIRNQLILLIISFSILFFLKPHLAALVFLAVFYYIITYTYKLKFNYRAIIISISSLIILLNFDLLNQSLGFLNLQISNFAAESVNYIPSKMAKLKVVEIGFNLESMFNILISIFQFFFRPYPWSSGANIFVYIQSVENIIVIIIFTYLIFELYKNNKSKCIFWVFSFIITVIPYSIIVANDGTLSRYRFSLIFPFLIIFIYENTKELIKKNEKL